MYHGFKLHAESLYDFHVTNNYVKKLRKKKEIIKSDLDSFYLENGNLDGKKLRDAWFPNYGEYHVFISHSHKDLDLAEKLANWLYDNFGIESFIDSYIWGFSDELLKEIDEKYALNPEEDTYSYKIRNHTTSHVHMMLNNALTTMIDSSECLIFLNTENAIDVSNIERNADENRTKSPWIMSEIQTSQVVQKQESPKANRQRATLESRGETATYDSVSKNELNIEHAVDTGHLSNLKAVDLKQWKRLCEENEKKYDALTLLYSKFGLPEMKDLHNVPRLTSLDW